MKYSEMVFLGGLAIFAGTTLHASIGMPYSADRSFGPGFMPLNMSIAILAIIVITAVRKVLPGRAALPENPSLEAKTGVAKVLATVTLIAAAVLVARLGSLLLPLGLCMLLVTALFLARGWRIGVISTIATLTVIYGIFGLWLRIPIR